MAIATSFEQGSRNDHHGGAPNLLGPEPFAEGPLVGRHTRGAVVRAGRVRAFLLAAASLGVAAAGAAVGDGRVPFDRIAPPTQERLKDVMDGAAFQRTVQGLTFRSREPVFVYLLDHPVFATAVARALRVAEYRAEQLPDGTYWGDDARGAKGIIDIVYADPRKRVIYARGTYDRKWLPTIHARLVLILEFEHTTGADGQPRATNDLTGYLRVDDPILGALARLVGPLVGGAVDRKVARTFGVAGRVSERAYDDPAGFLQALQGHPDVDRRDLAALAARLAQADGTHARDSDR